MPTVRSPNSRHVGHVATLMEMTRSNRNRSADDNVAKSRPWSNIGSGQFWTSLRPLRGGGRISQGNVSGRGKGVRGEVSPEQVQGHSGVTATGLNGHQDLKAAFELIMTHQILQSTSLPLSLHHSLDHSLDKSLKVSSILSDFSIWTTLASRVRKDLLK